MANKNNITINSTPKYGYNLTRTSFDARQEINAKVIGVLRYNDDIRRDLLKRNITGSNYNLNSDTMGVIADFYSFSSRKPSFFGEKGLLQFTHIDESDYQKSINQKYDFGSFVQYYRHGSLPDGNYQKWNGLYNDYREYFNEVFGLPITQLDLISGIFEKDKLNKGLKLKQDEEVNLTVQSILNDFLQYDNIKYAMEKTRIGTVKPNPLAALSGVITTNINNFSGKDTALGMISNQMYAHTLRNSAQFNSLRKTRYITPEVYDIIGNKLSTIATLASDFRIDDETGRLSYELGESYANTISLENTNFNELVNLVIDADRNIADNNNARYRNIARNIYKPFINEQYSIDKSVDLMKGFVSPTINNKVYKLWNEGDNGNRVEEVFTYNYQSGFSGIRSADKTDGLLKKTQELFNSHDDKGIDTLIGRFHTSGGRDVNHNEASLFQTAVSKFGMSHGRNLLNKTAYEYGIGNNVNSYENPYCRTWTYHHQYDSLGDLIRPFSSTNNSETKIKSIEELQSNWYLYGRRKDGAYRLSDNSSLNKNGYVNITPTVNDDNTTDVDVKRCMFSIENLAWKDVTKGINKNVLSPEQIGPNGGRIMWFPPYALKFDENVQANWVPSDFIGRGEKVYTYTNTERTGTLSFVILVDHPSILDEWSKRESKGTVDDEQKILRFFAGCDELELNNITIPVEETPVEVEPEEDPVIIPIVEEEQPGDDIIFYIFFPNNYSGIDNVRNAISYISTQYEDGDGKPHKIEDEDKPYGKWKYRVDDFILKEGQGQTYSSNYEDTTDFGLNQKLDKVKSNKTFEDATNTFFDLIGGLTDNILSGRTVTNATVQAYASSHGYSKTNAKLIENRRSFAYEFVKNKLGVDNIEKLNGGVIEIDNIDKSNVSGESAKRARCAKVVLKTKKMKKTVTLPEMTLAKPVTTNTKTIIQESISFNKTIEVNNDTSLTKKEKRALRNFRKNPSQIVGDNITDVTAVIKPELSSFDIPNKLTEKQLVAQLSNKNTKILTGQQIEDKDRRYRESVESLPSRRWDAEAQYFKMLKDNDSFLYDRIVDKIKYFTPAFHSITPEGFNARLSFLHQCTRQGMTMSVSDTPNGISDGVDVNNGKNAGKKYMSAGNLSFGRPPVCVLRIGDFYHTKIIITNLRMDYEDPVWDMNPEGIGMQPMFAKVTLSFTFLGGSDLTAPISRLQNAVSFNYYANQSIYDDRADIGVYDEQTNKAIIRDKPWKP